MYAHDVPAKFPHTAAELSKYDVIVLSDIGTNSFLLPIETWLQGKSTPNRLKLLAEWVENGGALIMAGGYLSFQGFEAKARFAGTAVEAVLPVTCLTYDDRAETPEGASARRCSCRHARTARLQQGGPEAWRNTCCNGWRRSAHRHRAGWQGSFTRLDLGHWPTLVPRTIRTVERFRATDVEHD
jgi:uncharacterized membrane protein